jgi:DNA-directed RNA polymerase-3 subunit RPC5
MRIKPKTGFMEIDISTTVHANFDKTKGLIWGEALKSAKDHGAAGFGLASGFGKGSRSTELYAAERAHISRRREEESAQAPLSRFKEANEDGRVLNKQTLGGQIIKPEPGKPIYMLGAFKGSRFAYPHSLSPLLIGLRATPSYGGHWSGANAAAIPPY